MVFYNFKIHSNSPKRAVERFLSVPHIFICVTSFSSVVDDFPLFMRLRSVLFLFYFLVLFTYILICQVKSLL